MSKPKILLFDIETRPMTIHSWTVWKANALEVLENVKLMSVAWKWFGEKKVYFAGLPDYELYDDDPSDDYAVVLELRNLLDEADIVIAHNGKAFDIPRTNARMAVHGIAPPSPYLVIDTLKVARTFFKFDSNRLNDLGQVLEVGKKLPHTGFDLWKRCMQGDPSAWKLMKDYNIQDVQLLEDVYVKLRPFIQGHPNMGLHFENMCCTNCGSENVQQRGYKHTRTRRYKQYVCNDCGAWCRHRLSEKENLPSLTN